MTRYISRDLMLKNLNADLEHHADEGDPLTILIMQRFIRYVEDFPTTDVQLVVDTENLATVSDEFICKECGIYLKDYIKTVLDEDNDGHIDEQHYDYDPKFCPECGAKVRSCIKTSKDKPLPIRDEYAK